MNNKPTSSNSRTDWQRLDAMRDEEIDLSDSPEITPEMFAKAMVRQGLSATIYLILQASVIIKLG